MGVGTATVLQRIHAVSWSPSDPNFCTIRYQHRLTQSYLSRSSTGAYGNHKARRKLRKLRARARSDWEARKSFHRGFLAPSKSIPNSLLALHLYDVEAQCSAHLLQTIRRGSLRTAGASMRPLSHETGARKEEQWQQTNKTTSRSSSLS